jgi:hypothetical protein
MNYGFQPFTGPMLPPFPGVGYPMAVFGADATAQPTTMDKIKTALGAQNSVIPVKNGYLLAGAGAIAVLIYGSYEGWFGR